jgi:hypothetical protein
VLRSAALRDTTATTEQVQPHIARVALPHLNREVRWKKWNNASLLRERVDTDR